jgi:tetratricopeptide (TPR) repeat protein
MVLLKFFHRWLKRLWGFLSSFFSLQTSGRRTQRQINQPIYGKSNQTIGDIQAEGNVNITFPFLEPILPDAKFKLPEPFYQAKLNNFVGRETELDQLSLQLIESSKLAAGNNVICIYGTPGVGKSALACYFATRYKEQFPEGVYGLRVDSKEIDLKVIVRRFVNLTGRSFNLGDERDAPTIMQELFADRKVLLIFDNVESTDIRALFPGGRRCGIIVTTRRSDIANALNLPTDRQITLNSLQESDSLKLLKKLVDGSRINAEIEIARHLVNRIGNLPLALQVIGATLNTGIWLKLPLRDYAEALKAEKLKLLQQEVDQSLDVIASFSLSLKDLSQETKDFFTYLGICATTSISLSTIMAVTRCNRTTARSCIDQLVRRSLVSKTGTEQERYSLHTLIHEFANYLLQEQGFTREAKTRHANYFLDLVCSNDLEDGDILAQLDSDIEDVFLAAKWLSSNATDYSAYILRLEDFFEQYGHWREALDLIHEFCINAEHRQHWSKLVELRCLQTEFLLLIRAIKEAEAVLEAITQQQTIERIIQPDVRQRCEAMRLRTLSSIYRRQKKFPQAEKVLRQSYIILTELEDIAGKARVLNKLGTILHRQNNDEQAVEVLLESQAIYKELNYKRGLAKVFKNLGVVLCKQGHLAKSLNVLEQSLSISEELDDQRGLSIILHLLGITYQVLEQFEDAEVAFKRSHEISQNMKDDYGQVITLKDLLLFLQTQGKLTSDYISI